MLNLSVFSHNHHPSGVNLLAKYIRRGIWVLQIEHHFIICSPFLFNYITLENHICQ